jgi:sigma-B regulation protein RsbU (phosphoserine phosphatase)
MLSLADFFHLSQVDTLLAQIAGDGPGLIVVAGLDARPAASGESFLPSGRSAIFRILLREILALDLGARGLIVSRESVRVPRDLRRRVEVLAVQPPATPASRIAEAARLNPALLAVDPLDSETLPAALDAAREGQRVLAQMDIVFRGASVAQHLLDLGATAEQLRGLAWIVAVQRVPVLCPNCRQPVPPDPAPLDRLRRRYPALDDVSEIALFRAGRCDQCSQTGLRGDAIAFDIFRADPDHPDLLDQDSLLPMGEYVARLALAGHAPLSDALRFEEDQFRRAHNLFLASERALHAANERTQSKLVELEAANRVMEQRTQALIALQNIGQALLESTDLSDFASRVCRRARDLCGAERAVLYGLLPGDLAVVLAVAGWSQTHVGRHFPAATVIDPAVGAEPVTYQRWPLGFEATRADVESVRLRAGLYVPLIAQDQAVGVMIVQSTQKRSFAPGEVALLQTFANQAALAIQRAQLIEDLRAKIAALEAAQAGLAQKERMERELELARQVQQSVLPRSFPLVFGYQFAARNEPARRVGGDFYDVIALDDDHFGVVIADVSDKGIPAALYMALTRSLLLAEARRGRSPVETLRSVNNLLRELGEPNMFVTVFYGVVERATRRLTYTRAGHDRPVVLRNGSYIELGGQGTMLGLLNTDLLRLSEERIALRPGDTLALFTDGLRDVQSPEGTLFSREQFIAMLRARAGLPPDAMIAAIFADLAAYQGSADQYDDTTLLVVAVE